MWAAQRPDVHDLDRIHEFVAKHIEMLSRKTFGIYFVSRERRGLGRRMNTESCASGEAHFCNSAVQLMTTTMGDGSGSPTSVFMRNRSPSGLTS